jgi:geranylgeranyl diphosphate synthase, type I
LLERSDDATLDDVLAMEGGKTAALIACSSSIGARAAGAPDSTTDPLAEYGRLVGLAFQLVDDVLGIVGDPQVTGKSASSDLRAGKRSIPVVAALQSGTDAGDELAKVLAAGPPTTDTEVARAARLVEDAGGIAWANAEAARLVDLAAAEVARAGISGAAAEQFAELSGYLVRRAR